MGRRIWSALLLLGLVVGWLLSWQAFPGAQSLSAQVLQLLTRANVWTGRQEFRDLRIAELTPTDTTRRLYVTDGNLWWDNTLIGDVGTPTVIPHNVLSAFHSDTLGATVARGALIVGNATPAWSRLTVGAAGTVLRSDGTDVAWSTNGSALTALNASNLGSGTVPLARLSGITDTEISGSAAIAWSKISKNGSSLADLATRSASDLTSGTLADGRLSANVSLLGAAVDTAEITDGAVTNAKVAAATLGLDKLDPLYAGCDVGEAVGIAAGPVVACIPNGVGTVTSVGLSAPAIFSVANSPVTSAGTLALSLATQSANLVWAGPSTGSPAAPTFRALVNADLPLSGVSAGTYPKVTVNTRGVVTAANAQITLTTDVTGVLPTGNGGTGLSTATDDTVLVGNGSAWTGLALPNTGTTGALQYTTGTNTFSALANVTTASNTQTLTNKVINSVNNDIYMTQRIPALLGSCGLSTDPPALWGGDNGTTDPAGISCHSLTDRALRVADFDDTTSEAITYTTQPPVGWTGVISFGVIWFAAATTGQVVWAVDTYCWSFSTAPPETFSGVVARGGSPHPNSGRLTITEATPTLSGCSEGYPMVIRVRRLPTDGGDTMTGDARLVGLSLIFEVVH